jgi:hypothetical protein
MSDASTAELEVRRGLVRSVPEMIVRELAKVAAAVEGLAQVLCIAQDHQLIALDSEDFFHLGELAGRIRRIEDNLAHLVEDVIGEGSR